MEIKDPEIEYEEILIPKDIDLNPNNVCIVTGLGNDIGRATAIASAANKLMTVLEFMNGIRERMRMVYVYS